MKNSTRSDYQKELLAVAKNTKNALIAQWEASDAETKYFKDKDTLSKKGVLSEGIGLTSLLLLIEAFGDGDKVFSPDEKDKIGEIVNSSLKKIESWTKNGYVATPLISSTSKAFNAEAGYTDSVTWCLSSAILARYEEKSGKITLDDDVREYVFDAIAKGIDALCKSQSEGKWGFRTDLESPRSLYFTYSAAASIADFYDYILGEIALLDLDVNASEKEIDDAISAACDREVISAVNAKLGYDVSEKLGEVRAALQDWLIHDALPLFPKIASCGVLDDETLNALGMWKHDSVDVDGGENGKKIFHNLYYTFYLLDMMVTAGVDTRYAEMAKDLETMKDLANYYAKNNRLNATDTFYFFYDGEFDEADIKNGEYHFEELFSKNVECALYAARSQYAIASKTGADFWNTAELPLTLSHPNKVISSAIPSSKDFKDPSVVAMALRSNITYSYYVTETQDIAVERLFNDMCADIFTTEYLESLKPVEGDEDYDQNLEIYESKLESCAENLWDCENFSLALTERSIEALVDFKDYLDKFYFEEEALPAASEPAPAPAVKATATEKSPLDLVFEAKIEEYLQSPKGKEIIEAAVAEKLKTVELPKAEEAVQYTASGNIPSDKLLADWINAASEDIQRSNPLEGKRDDLLETMLDLFEALRRQSFMRILRDNNFNERKIVGISNSFESQRKSLLREIGNDAQNSDNDNMYDLENLYEALKAIRGK